MVRNFNSHKARPRCPTRKCAINGERPETTAMTMAAGVSVEIGKTRAMNVGKQGYLLELE